MDAPTFPEEFNLADYYLFDRLREGLGDKVALLFGDQRHTYADVAGQVRRLRAHLAVEDVAPEQRVLIVLHDSPAFVWAFFAALHHGAVVAMGNPEAPAADLAYLIEYTRPAAVVTIQRVAESIQDALAAADLRTLVLVPEVATGGDLEADLPASPALDPLRCISLRNALAQGRTALVPRSAPIGPRPTRRDDIALWLFTSGSTGRSKAAVHTHRDFAFNTECYAKATAGYRKEDITVSVPRLFFGYATGTNLMFPFAVGATAGLFVERPTPESLGRYIERYRPTVVTNVPTMMGKLLEHDDASAARGEPRLDLSSVRFHLSAGEALPPALLERFRARFQADVYDGIGSAEMFHIYCTNRPGDVRPGSLGRVVEGYTIKILPSDAIGPGAPELAPGETGVMWVKGDSVALGYFQDREKSWSTFHGHWCRTGDLFRMDAEGYLWFSGRADELLKVGGVWVAPVEVEECLTEHPAVSLAAVIGAEEAGLVKPKAFIVVRDDARGRVATGAGRAELAAELKAFVKDRLSKHKYPRWVVFVDDVPRNDRGKVDRKALRQREAGGETPAGL
ncbi:benzoate-CoA ligase family protein [Sorangium sp. So ce362]|uniref:benzoate-CoA ligase family protein n=1 Tax=Sorangium sp. So ce362 TaxID=3133303 RepID=UPI003F61C28C